MRIVITTGLSAGDIGGPFQYGPRLKEEFEAFGHTVRLISYGQVERVLPIGLRHLYFFFKILDDFAWADKILTLDTFSVGIPSVWAARLLGKKIIVRVGGDFLWSAYVNRTSAPLTLPDFYKSVPALNLKERLILFFTRIFINSVDYLAFNTEWQKKIWQHYYHILDGKAYVIRNFIPERQVADSPTAKDFVWAGRLIPEKNPKMLERLGVHIVTNKSHSQVWESLKRAYGAVSLAYTDICPNFIIEAASIGKPFVMTRETGLREIIPEGGIFVDPRDEGEIKAAIAYLEDKDIYMEYVEKLGQSYKSHSWAEIAIELINIWKRS